MCVNLVSPHRVHTDVHSNQDHTGTSPSLCHRCCYYGSYISAGSSHQICPEDILRNAKNTGRKAQKKPSQHNSLTLVSTFAFSRLQRIMCVIVRKSRWRKKEKKKKRDLVRASPLSQCAPVQPRLQVQFPVAASHTPPLLQLQRWTQSAPNQPGGQSEGRTHTLKLKGQFKIIPAVARKLYRHQDLFSSL